jgi:transposase
MIDLKNARVFLYTRPADLRKGFSGLYAIARTHIDDPARGDLFLFVNRRRTIIKALHWDGTGLCVFAKRLAKGRFEDLFSHASQKRSISQHQLRRLLQGATIR